MFWCNRFLTLVSGRKTTEMWKECCSKLYLLII